MPQKSTNKQLFTFYLVVKDKDEKLNFLCYPIAGNGKNVAIKKVQKNFTQFSQTQPHLLKEASKLQKWTGEIFDDSKYTSRSYVEYKIAINCQPPSDPLEKNSSDPFFKYTNCKRGYKPTLNSYTDVLLKSAEVISEKANLEFFPDTLETLINLLTNMYRGKEINMKGVKGKLLSVFIRHSDEKSQATNFSPDLIESKYANSATGKEFLSYINAQDDFGLILDFDLFFSSWHIGNAFSSTDKTFPQKVVVNVRTKDVRDLIAVGALNQNWKIKKKEAEKQKKKLEKLKAKREQEAYYALLNDPYAIDIKDGKVVYQTPPTPSGPGSAWQAEFH